MMLWRASSTLWPDLGPDPESKAVLMYDDLIQPQLYENSRTCFGCALSVSGSYGKFKKNIHALMHETRALRKA